MMVAPFLVPNHIEEWCTNVDELFRPAIVWALLAALEVEKMLLGTYQIMFRYLLFSCCCSTIFLPCSSGGSLCTEPKPSTDSKSMMGCFFYQRKQAFYYVKHFSCACALLLRRLAFDGIDVCEGQPKTTTTIWNDVYFSLICLLQKVPLFAGGLKKVKRVSCGSIGETEETWSPSAVLHYAANPKFDFEIKKYLKKFGSPFSEREFRIPKRYFHYFRE